MQPPAVLVFDVESLGLHGPGFAVGACVTQPDGTMLIDDDFYGALQPAALHIVARSMRQGLSATDWAWVQANVLPHTPGTHASLLDLRWDFLTYVQRMRCKYPGLNFAVDCGWPVEANWLWACLLRATDADLPVFYPVHEIASVLASAGADPLGTYDRLANELPKHNPLCDARQSARLFRMACVHLATNAAHAQLLAYFDTLAQPAEINGGPADGAEHKVWGLTAAAELTLPQALAAYQQHQQNKAVRPGA